MSTTATHNVTRLLKAWSDGSAQAPEQLLPLIYDQLRRTAREYMRRERGDHTLQPTALVHEAYLRLTAGETIDWQDRAHFYHLAARAMRRILVDHAVAKKRLKRGGPQERISLTQAEGLRGPEPEDETVDIIALDSAIDRLKHTYARQSQVVELRFFGGMEMRDIAEVLQVSEKTVLRDWQFARLWLHRELVTANE